MIDEILELVESFVYQKRVKNSNHDPQDLLKEIVLVDDGSENDEIKTILPLYIKYRLHKYPGKY